MVFCNFVKRVKYSEKIQFFQSSYPYLKNQNALSQFHQFYNSEWFNEDPHPSATPRNFLGIDTGHYGLYFTIFNHDSDKNKRKQHRSSLKYDYDQLAEGNSQHRLFDNFTKFIILQANQDIYNNISYLKTVSRDFLSTLSIIRPKFSVNTTRRFSTVAIRNHQNNQHHQHQINETAYEELIEDKEEDFESNLLHTQISNIEAIYAKQGPTELNLIYPLYQTLKRNCLQLPSIHLYNIVLKSIVERKLDNDARTFENIESRLTNLLTVYQDILVGSSEQVKPNKETYEIVLNELLRGSLQTIELGNMSDCPQSVYNESFIKSQEFSQIGIELFMSINKIENLDLSMILPQLFSILNVHSNLITKDLFVKILNLNDNVNSESGIYYIGLIGLSRYFSKLQFFQLKEEFYNFIVSTYQSYKNNSQAFEKLTLYEYDVYSILVLSLVKSDNFPLATKFLDDILVDYKSSLHSFKSSSISKKQISNLLSAYLDSIMSNNYSRENLNKSYNLLMKFNELSYIPELSVTLYNNMINQFVNQYHILENEKYELAKTSPEKIEALSKLQASYYRIMWNLYSYLAIRKDYHHPLDMDSISLILNNKTFNCREYLLSLSIDLGDHEKVFQIIKEILLKNHLIQDTNVLKKLNNYLYSGSTNNGFNAYYFELMSNIIENQAVHYANNSKLLNNYVSETINYLLLQNNEYNVKLLLKSVMVNETFSDFDLQSDNIYGVLQISKFLIQYINSGIEKVDEPTIFKILHFQSLLINEFENTENHYIQLDSEMNEFKGLLKTHFINSMSYYMTIPGFRVTNDIIDACTCCDFEISSPYSEVAKNHEVDLDYDLNLAFLLNINYNTGIERFIDFFNKGYKFTYSTWKIIINQNFVLTTLEKNTRIGIDEFVNTILQLNFEMHEKNNLLDALIKIENEKVNIHLFKVLLKFPLIINNNLLKTFMQAIYASPNQYLATILNENFEYLIEHTDKREWINGYFKYLIKNKNYNQINKIVESGYPIHDLSLKSSIDIEILQSIFETFIASKKFNEFNTVFKNYFSTPESNRILMNNMNLINVLIKYYTLNGSFNLVLQKFKPIADQSKDTRNLIEFVEFMQTLSGESRPIEISSFNDSNELAINLMKAADLHSMNEMFQQNKKFNKNSLFGLMMNNYIKAATINDSLSTSQLSLVNNFQKSLKFMKLIRFTNISIDNLNLIIKFLAVTKSVDKLSILTNKIIGDNKIADLVNFYFLEFLFTNPTDKLIILQTLRDAFTYLRDPINTYIVNQFCQEQKIDLQDNDFRMVLNDSALC